MWLLDYKIFSGNTALSSQYLSFEISENINKTSLPKCDRCDLIDGDTWRQNFGTKNCRGSKVKVFGPKKFPKIPTQTKVITEKWYFPYNSVLKP